MYKTMMPNLMVEDVYSSQAWYRDVLGFELEIALANGNQEILTTVDEEMTLEFAMLSSGGVTVMLQQKQSLVEDVPVLSGIQIGASLVLYVEVDDVDACYESLREKVDVLEPPQTRFYGMREWYCRDCNGYVICLAEDVSEPQEQTERMSS